LAPAAAVKGDDQAEGSQSEDPGTEDDGADLVIMRDRRGAMGTAARVRCRCAGVRPLVVVGDRRCA
jgi:predicted transcriptional regulator